MSPMMPTIEPTRTAVHRPRRTGAMALLLAAATGFTAGCNRSDELHIAVGEARNTLSALGAAGAEATPIEARSKAYNSVVALLQEKIKVGGPSMPLAQGILAEALLGQGEVAAVAFREADAQVMRAMTDAHAKLMLSFQQRGLSDALKGYDPRADVARLDKESADRAAGLKAAQADLAEAAAHIEDLRKQSKALAQQGDAKRQEYAAIRSRALGAGAADRAEIVRQANDVKRQGELILVQAEQLEAEADRYSPELEEKKLEIQRYEKQIASLAEARKNAEETARMLAAQSAQAATDAGAAADAASKSMTELAALVEQSLKPAFDGAMAKLDAARTAIGQARDAGGRNASQAAAGNVHLARASLLREYSQALARVGAVLEQAAKAQIPGGQALGESAKALAAQSAEAKTSAAEALEQASSAFQSVGGEDSPAAKLAARLDAERKELVPELPAAPEAAPDAGATDSGGAEAAPAPESQPGEQPADSPASESTPPASDAPQEPQAPPSEPASGAR